MVEWLPAKEEGKEIEEEGERNGRAKKVVLAVTAVLLENRVLISIVLSSQF